MAEVSFTINRGALRRFTGSNDMQVAMSVVGQFVEASAKRHAPVRTGNLRRSIYHEVNRHGTSWITRVGTNVRYGIFQEVGTIHHPAHPFLRPALDEFRKALRLGEL